MFEFDSNVYLKTVGIMSQFIFNSELLIDFICYYFIVKPECRLLCKT